MNAIDEVRAKTDIVEVISASGVNLRKTGRSFMGFCPFHPNTRTPAFAVYPDSQSFYCFGCHASGSVFDYVMRKQGLDFKDALEQLAARAGVRLEPKSDQERQEDTQRTRLLEINAAAAKYFNYVLLSHSRGAPGRAYIEKRGISPEMVEAFQLGYSLDDWTHLFNYLTQKKGFDPADVITAGLAIDHATYGPYDRFRARVVFPIRDAKGQIVGFGGRALENEVQPKYLNSPETPLFHKSDLLYGLDLAREAIRSEDRAVLVEGYVDVITAHQHGFRNVVAPLGTAITKNQVGLLKRLSHNVYMALDADSAGQKATVKGLSVLRESAEEGEGGRVVVTAQGAVRLESDVSLRIIRMPAGRDPDEVIKSDPELWRHLLDSAVPVMEFYIEVFTAGLEMSEPQNQRLALEKLLPLLAELDGVQQRIYISRLEQVVGIRADLIADMLRGGIGRIEPERRRPGVPRSESRPPVPAPVAPSMPANTARNMEQHLIVLALRYSTVVPAAIEALLEQGLERFPHLRGLLGGGLEDLLEDPANQQIWATFSTLPITQRPANEAELLIWAEHLAQPLREHITSLLKQAQRKPQDFRYRREAEDCARIIRQEQARRLHRMMLQRIASMNAEEVEYSAERQLTALAQFIADTSAPRRSTTFPDLRDSIRR
ncbi:DNA primase [Oscillochloris trichoides DG-6]|uniref:DNA primase n=1 Tax=Oscillochloris trichoides DG-6 TaxID=765420 RepID=E1IF82_9CHLR|nr:DNA primase [Oscillochloris trichoides]EFO80181.1 DNA primase [Oscillochloris trichoides DG-6]